MSDQNEPTQSGALPSVPLQPVVRPLYRCGWCGMPTDSFGVPLKCDDPEGHVNNAVKDGRPLVLLNGNCCPEGSPEYRNQQPTRDMLIDGGLL